MQYTLRNVPPHLDAEIRRRAQREGRSLNELVLDLLRRAVGLSEGRTRRRSLRDLAGTWVEDPETMAALAQQDRVDPELWR